MFAKNLKYLRSQKGYTQKELADKLGYKSLVTVHHWENGTNACPSSCLGGDKVAIKNWQITPPVSSLLLDTAVD